MQEPHITVTGHVGAPPRLRVLSDGTVVTDFRLAATPRHKDASGAWTDGTTMWFGVSCWRALAENVAASVHKGDKLVVSGQLRVSTWTTEAGEVRSGLEIVRPTVGFDLSRGKAVLEKNPPLVLTTDPGYPVDTDTGELVGAPPSLAGLDPSVEDLLDDELEEARVPVGALR